MNCGRCKNILSGKQKKWCSLYCSKLALKSQYRKRNRDKINAYKRNYNRFAIRGNPSTNNIIKSYLLRNPYCLRCETKQDLQVCHIRPRAKGGKNKDNLITLCRKHHIEFDNLLKNFWQDCKPYKNI